jgi:hypothetical protein
MIISGVVTLLIVGAAIEQRRFQAGTLIHPLAPGRGAWALEILQAAGALGVLSMVLIQSFKRPVRSGFHSRAIKQWLGESDSPDPERLSAYSEILDFIAPSYGQDILGLPIEQLSAQLASAADLALIGHRKSLLNSLAGKEAQPCVDRYLELLNTEPRSTQQGPEPQSAQQSLNSETMPELLEARNTLSHVIQRRIDGFQIHFGNEWRDILRVIAITLSAFLATMGILVSGELTTLPFTAVAFALVVGLMGGLLASVARDVVAIIEKYRR